MPLNKKNNRGSIIFRRGERGNRCAGNNCDVREPLPEAQPPSRPMRGESFVDVREMGVKPTDQTDRPTRPVQEQGEGPHTMTSCRSRMPGYRLQGDPDNLPAPAFTRLGRGGSERGDRWHCPARGADICQDCGGCFGRDRKPIMRDHPGARAFREAFDPALPRDPRDEPEPLAATQDPGGPANDRGLAGPHRRRRSRQKCGQTHERHA